MKKIIKFIVYFVLWILLVASFQRCDNSEPVVKSPFSHLDTVKAKNVTPAETKNSDGPIVKSPFSGLDKK